MYLYHSAAEHINVFVDNVPVIMLFCLIVIPLKLIIQSGDLSLVLR